MIMIITWAGDKRSRRAHAPESMEHFTGPRSQLPAASAAALSGNFAADEGWPRLHRCRSPIVCDFVCQPTAHGVCFWCPPPAFRARSRRNRHYLPPRRCRLRQMACNAPSADRALSPATPLPAWRRNRVVSRVDDDAIHLRFSKRRLLRTSSVPHFGLLRHGTRPGHSPASSKVGGSASITPASPLRARPSPVTRPYRRAKRLQAAFGSGASRPFSNSVARILCRIGRSL